MHTLVTLLFFRQGWGPDELYVKDDYGIFVSGDDLSINHGVLDHTEFAALSLSPFLVSSWIWLWLGTGI